ncbi:MAG TPA: VRR-NUC domain-containing protein [Pseudomonadales bacterium]|nr:VRR-NUC domain-containing protein [Pseudomonadales bacterium]
MAIPADYYVDKLRHMSAWVRRHHGALVPPRLSGFLAAFDRLPDDARRLLLRLLMRRGPHFRLDRLAYAEVGDVTTATLALALAGVARLQVDVEVRLGLLRVPELRALLDACGVPVPPAGQRRDVLLCRCRELPRAQLDARLPAAVTVRLDDVIAPLRLLFFGGLRQDLTEFILADIGTLRFAVVPLSPRLPWSDRAGLERSLVIHRVADHLHDLERILPADADASWHAPLDALADALAGVPEDAQARGRRARALIRLAELQARAGRPERRLALLRMADQPPARERLCRLLAAAGRTADADRVQACMRAAPADAVERRFAERFDTRAGRCRPQRRGSVRIRFTRLVLPRLESPLRIEARVADHLAAFGSRALHLENHLPGMLFLLGFWDILFEPLPGAFVQPFQAGPTDLFEADFRARRAGPIDARLAAIADGTYGCAHFLAVARQHCGTLNPFWPWSGAGLRAADAILRSLPPALRAAICAYVAEDPLRARRGFPDLTVANGVGGCVAFWEVKGPGDQLRPAQRDWLEQLTRAGAQAAVMEVRWA